MEKTRPYWKVIVSLLFSLLVTVLFIYIGVKAIAFFAPFVVGWIVASIANPLAKWLEKRLKIKRKVGSVIVIILVLAAVIGILYLAISTLVSEVGALLQDFPNLYKELSYELETLAERLNGVWNLLPSGVQGGITSFNANLEQTMGEFIGKISEPTVNAASRVAKSIPSIFVGSIVALISTYFFVADRDSVVAWAKKMTPTFITDRISMVVQNLKHAVGGYFKAQFQIMGVVGILLFIGFAIMGVKYGIIFAILIALLDFFPFFGTGTALVPWTVYKLCTGDYKMAIMLLVLYAITQVVRQLIQPKLVGDGVGLKPLPTLVFIYVGYKVGSILGMILAVPIGMIAINMYHAGAFDYILDDIKILLKGILSLRE